MGMEKPHDTRSFIISGRLRENKVIPKNYAGVMFLAWRCLYAEIVQGKVNKVTPKMEEAFKRSLVMNHSRLTAYGEKWLKWVNKNKNTGNKHDIPPRHQDKRVLTQELTGEYEIHTELLQAIERVKS